MSVSALTEGRSARPGRAAGKRRRTQAERSQETRTRILDAAVEVMRRRGYAQFRIAEVARLAGVSRGAQLHHYATKEKLVFATLEHVFHRALDASRGRARAVRSGEDVLARIMADAREFFFSDSFFISLDIVLSITDVRFRKQVLAMVRGARLPAEQAWREALVASGVAERLADDILWLTLSIVRGLALRTLLQNEPARFDRLFDVWRQIVQGLIESGGPAKRRQGR